MKPLLQSVLATGAIALLLAVPVAPLAAAPGSPVRSGPAAAVLGQTGPEAIPVHDRWDHRHRSGGRHHGYPGRRAYRHRPHRHHPYRHHPYRHRPHGHRPHWRAYIYWGIPHPCFVARPWRPGHWRHHHHRHDRGHRHRVPRHRHVHCHGGFTVVLPLSYPPRHYR